MMVFLSVSVFTELSIVTKLIKSLHDLVAVVSRVLQSVSPGSLQPRDGLEKLLLYSLEVFLEVLLFFQKRVAVHCPLVHDPVRIVNLLLHNLVVALVWISFYYAQNTYRN